MDFEKIFAKWHEDFGGNTQEMQLKNVKHETHMLMIEIPISTLGYSKSDAGLQQKASN